MPKLDDIAQSLVLALDAKYKVWEKNHNEPKMTTYLYLDHPSSVSDPVVYGDLNVSQQNVVSFRFKEKPNVDTKQIKMAIIRLDPPRKYGVETQKDTKTSVWGVFKNKGSDFALTPYVVTRDMQDKVRTRQVKITTSLRFKYDPEKLAMEATQSPLGFVSTDTPIDAAIADALYALEQDAVSVTTKDIGALVLLYANILFNAVVRFQRGFLEDSVFYQYLTSKSFQDVERRLRKKLMPLDIDGLASIVDTIDNTVKDCKTRDTDDFKNLAVVLTMLRGFVTSLHYAYFKKLDADSAAEKAEAADKAAKAN